MTSILLEELKDKFNKINNYNKNLYTLSINYLNELQQNLDSKDILNILDQLLNNNNFDKYNKKVQTDNITKIDFYINILQSKEELNKLLDVINNLNIYEEKTLLSDKSKNTINANKLVIQQLRDKIQIKYIKFIELYVTYIISNFQFTYENYIYITDLYQKTPIILDLYIEIIKNYLYNQDITPDFKNYILYTNKKFENDIITKELEHLKIKTNSNDLNDYNYLFKNNITNIKLNNIINKYNQYYVSKSYLNFETLFHDIFSYNNIDKKNNNLQSNNLDSKNLKYIYQILQNYYKIEKKYVGVILIESSYDNINYNLVNLLNDNYQLQKNQGVNKQYINKTKTIVNKEEIFSLQELDSKFQNEIYISNIKNIHIINNYIIKSKLKQNEKEKILFDTDFLLIYINDKQKPTKKNPQNNIHIMTNNKNNNIFMSFLDVMLLLQNKVNYNIENYKSLLEHNILTNIEKNNMLELYNTKISYDYSNLPRIDNLELKNNIINKLKKITLKDIDKYRMENIDIIINIIINEIYSYIIKINNIELSSEIYLTYYSNISSFVNKLKKELHDKYDKNILLNIENILDNIYSNIISINNNILDKYYLIKL